MADATAPTPGGALSVTCPTCGAVKGKDCFWVEAPERYFPKTATCWYCKRRRTRKMIEWHPGVEVWQCSNFKDCDRARGAGT